MNKNYIKKLEEALLDIAKHSTKMNGPRGKALKALYGEEGMKDSQYYLKRMTKGVHKIS